MDVVKGLQMEDLLKDYPNIKKLISVVEGDPRIAKWIASRPVTTM